MTAVKMSKRSSPAWLMVLVVFAVIAIATIASVLVYLAMGGSLTVPFTDPPKLISFAPKAKPADNTPPAGWVAVPLSARKVQAYAALSRDDLLVPNELRPAVLYMDPAKVPDVFIRNIGDYIGRVLVREKPAGYAFTEDDFLPKGTRSGIVAGIPAGMRGMRVDLEKVRGLWGMRTGDRFDLVATLEVSDDAVDELKRLGGGVGERLALENSLQGAGKRATVRVIVQNAIVVSPAQTVEIPISSASLTGGRGTKTKPVQEVVIAVQPAEVGPLAEALAVEAEISVVPRSGRPDDPKDSVTPDLIPKRPFDDSSANADGTGLRLVETIGGSNREIVPVTKPATEKPK